MATQVQNRRGTTAEHSTFTGAVGELTVDTTKDTVVVHDGAVAGGRPLLREDQSNLPTTAPTRGIYNASGSLAISTGGSGRLFVGSDGRVIAGGDGTIGGTAILGAIGSTSGSIFGGTLALVQGRTPPNGSTLGVIHFGSETNPAGAVIASGAVGTWTEGSSQGSDLQFLTTNTGSASATERLRITSAGLVGVGDTLPDSTVTIKAAAATTPLKVSGPSSEFLRCDQQGRLLVGTSSARGWSGITPQFQLEGLDVNSASASFTANINSANGSFLSFIKSRGTALNSNTLVSSGDILGALYFNGADGTGPVQAAVISAQVDGTPGTNDMPGRLVFSTTADGASSPTERMRINNSGQTGVFCSSANAFYVSSSGAASTSDISIVGLHSAVGTYTGTASFIVRTNGNVQNTNNSYGAISDLKLKENIVDATSQWSDIKALQVRKYNFKEGQTHTQIGLVAQEVELVSPGLVTESPDRDAEGNDLGTVTKSVNYSVLYMKAVKALQEAMERIETLEAKVAALESA